MLRPFLVPLLLAAAVLPLLTGCSTAPSAPAETRLDAAQYAPAFAAAKQALRDADFRLEREDAFMGVLTTQPKPTAGLATPWDQEQQSAGQEVEEFLNRTSRQVRVTFEPSDPKARDAWRAAPSDLRDANLPLTLRVEAVVSRRQRPGWRLEPTAIRSSSRFSDPDLARRDMEPQFDTAIDQDLRFAHWLLDEISARLALPSPAAAATPTPTPAP